MPICLKIIVHDSLVDGTRLGHLGLSYVPKHLTGYSGSSFMEALIQFEGLTVWCNKMHLERLNNMLWSWLEKENQ